MRIAIHLLLCTSFVGCGHHPETTQCSPADAAQILSILQPTGLADNFDQALHALADDRPFTAATLVHDRILPVLTRQQAQLQQVTNAQTQPALRSLWRDATRVATRRHAAWQDVRRRAQLGGTGDLGDEALFQSLRTLRVAESALHEFTERLQNTCGVTHVLR